MAATTVRVKPNRTGPRTREVKVTDEAVAGGGWPGAWETYARTLPGYIDDLSRDLGDDIYERMGRDYKVESATETLKLSALDGDFQVLSPIDDKEDPDYELAQEIAAFCQANINGLTGSFVMDTLYDLLDAVSFGNRVAEIVCREGTDRDAAAFETLRSRGVRPTMLKALKPKPRRSVFFVVDAFWNVLGLLPAAPVPGSPTLLTTLPTGTENLLPRWKFAVLTFRPKDNDPRGQSIRRSAYTPWWSKVQMWAEWLRSLTQFGSPSLVGTCGENSQSEFVDNGDGTTTEVTPVQKLFAQLLAFRNGSVIALPPGGDVKPLQSTGQGTSVSPFTGAIGFFDKAIETAITGQNLATSEGEHNARAAADVHQDALGLPVRHARAAVESMVRCDIFGLLVLLNYGEEFLHLTPWCSLSDTEQQDFAKHAAALAKLGYRVHPSQAQALDARLGLPVRSEEAAGEGMGDPNEEPPADEDEDREDGEERDKEDG